jgi:hypothetical protein
MKRIYRNYIKRKVFAATFYFGEDTMRQCMDFVLDAPVRQWRLRLFVVRQSIGMTPVEKMESLFAFLNE